MNHYSTCKRLDRVFIWEMQSVFPQRLLGSVVQCLQSTSGDPLRQNATGFPAYEHFVTHQRGFCFPHERKSQRSPVIKHF